jgi:hypothetical protein
MAIGHTVTMAMGVAGAIRLQEHPILSWVKSNVGCRGCSRVTSLAAAKKSAPNLREARLSSQRLGLFEDKEEALAHGVRNELHPCEREHTKDRDKYQHHTMPNAIMRSLAASLLMSQDMLERSEVPHRGMAEKLAAC